MKPLINFIQEHDTNLQNYLIQEGLLNWLKKFWNNISSEARKNIKQNNGKYVIDENIKDAIEEGNYTKMKIQFPQYDQKTFANIMKDTKSDDKKGTFFKSFEYNQQHQKEKVFAIQCTYAGNINNLLGFLFIEGPIKGIIIITKIIYANKLKTDEKFDEVLAEAFKKFAKKSLSTKEQKIKDVTVGS